MHQNNLLFLWSVGQKFNQTNLCTNTSEYVAANSMSHKYLKHVLSENDENHKNDENHENDSTCVRPCTTVSYEASFRKMSHNSRTLSSATNSMIPDWIGFGLVYEDFQVTSNHEYYVMNTEALISNIGGFLGLFLGFSCLSIISWMFDTGLVRFSKPLGANFR